MVAYVRLGQDRNSGERNGGKVRPIFECREFVTLNRLPLLLLIGAFFVDFICPLYTSASDAPNRSDICDGIRSTLLQSTHRCQLVSSRSQRNLLRCDGFPLEITCRRPRRIAVSAAVFSHRIPIDGSNFSLCASPMTAAGAVISNCSYSCSVQSIGILCNGRPRCLLSTPGSELSIGILNNRCTSGHLLIQYSCVEPKLVQKSGRKLEINKALPSCPLQNISVNDSIGGGRRGGAEGEEKQRMLEVDALTLGNFAGRTSSGMSFQGNRNSTSSSSYPDKDDSVFDTLKADALSLAVNWIWISSFISDHFEQTVLYLVLGLMAGLLLLLIFCLVLVLLPTAFRRRRRQRKLLKELSISSRANMSTQTAESSTLVPSPSEHDYGLELLRFMHDGPPVKRDDRSAWMDAVGRQPLQGPLTASAHSATVAATSEWQHRLYMPTSTERLSDSSQRKDVRGQSWHSSCGYDEQSPSMEKSFYAEHRSFTTNSPYQVSPSSTDISSRGLIPNCTARNQLRQPTSTTICISSSQLYQPRGVSSFLQVNPAPSDTDPVQEAPSILRSGHDLSRHQMNREGSEVLLGTTTPSSKGLSKSLQNSPRDTGTTSADSFYSNPYRHGTNRLTSRSMQMLLN